MAVNTVADIKTPDGSEKNDSAPKAATLIRNHIIYYSLNFLLLGYICVILFSLTNIIIFAIIMLLTATALILKTNKMRPASSYLAFMLFMDVLAVIGFAYPVLEEYITVDGLVLASENLQWFYLFLIGFILGFINIVKKKKSFLLGWISAEVVVASFIIGLWGDGSVIEPYLITGGTYILIFFFVIITVWNFAARISRLAAPANKARISLMGIALLIFALIFILAEQNLVFQLAYNASAYLHPAADTASSWPQFILFALLMIAGAVVMYQKSNKKMGIDGLVFCVFAFLAVITKVIMVSYFPFNWLILVITVIWSLYIIKKEANSLTVFNTGNDMLLSISAVLFIIASKLLESGFWPVVAASIAFGIIFISIRGGEKGSHRYNAIWIFVLCCIAAEAIAWIWVKRFTMANVTVILVTLIIAVIAMVILSLPHPNKRYAPLYTRITVCLLYGLFCLIPVSRRGVNIHIQPDSDMQSATISIQARGKENAVDSAYYYWTDWMGNHITDDVDISEADSYIMRESERLTVVSTDIYGIKTTEVYWFPENFYY